MEELNNNLTRLQVVNNVQREKKRTNKRLKYMCMHVGRSNGPHLVVIGPIQ
jgi:hypothetical protein